MSPSVKCLLGKPEDLSWIPGTHIKIMGVLAHACNPGIEEAGLGSGDLLAGQPASLISESLANERLSQKTASKKQYGPLISTCM